ncbi:class I SAM-dependent methyltransferase [Pseudomonas sp.]|uniref:class I SAM-dependent methyltransferase n=1 Tax=Pseudomonas sp. TaxID=306 RepID=UPI0028A89F36|nr:class I SAM-dependent methyltransferase [Pseudomonas sp.]
MLKKPKWTGYYDAIGDEPARSTLLRALDHWNGPTGVALDLGCGTARDTLELLARGWDVIAVDAQAKALERLSIRVPEGQYQRLTLLQTRFETLELP